MAIEVRLARTDRRNAMLDSPPSPRVRLSVFSAEERMDDDLRAARGIFLGVLLGGGAWAVIGLVIWLIAR